MMFNSFSFAVFLPIVFIIYWILPHKCRWFFLLIASYYFYMSWNPKYVLLILITTIVSYFAGILLENEKNEKKRRLIIIVSSVTCLGLLFFFKYFNFFGSNVVGLFNKMGLRINPITIKIVLPVGISFYTFQTLSYVIDVYRGKISPEHHFGVYAVFISFFPQLVAGPIERTESLLPQIKKEKLFDYSQVTYGLKLMAWGFF